jgi:hypothetical protein
MSRLLLLVCLVFVTALVPVSVARACINDRDTSRTEHEYKANYEFKVDYQDQDPKPTIESPPSSAPIGPLTMIWSGVGLLIATVGVITINVRRSSRA